MQARREACPSLQNPPPLGDGFGPITRCKENLRQLEALPPAARMIPDMEAQGVQLSLGRNRCAFGEEMNPLLHAAGRLHADRANGSNRREECHRRCRLVPRTGFDLGGENGYPQPNPGKLHPLAHIRRRQSEHSADLLGADAPYHLENKGFPEESRERGDSTLDFPLDFGVWRQLLGGRFLWRPGSQVFGGLRPSISFPSQIDAEISGQPPKPGARVFYRHGAAWKTIHGFHHRLAQGILCVRYFAGHLPKADSAEGLLVSAPQVPERLLVAPGDRGQQLGIRGRDSVR